MKNILLLTDFSDNSINAIKYALQFFKIEKCTMHLLYVHKSGTFTTDDLMLASGGSNIYDSIVKEPKEKLKTLTHSLDKEFNNDKHTFKTIIDFDDFTDAIKQVIKLKNIDFVVLGTNGATGAKEIIFGSNTLNVIRKIDSPTLIIPENYTYNGINEVLLPLDNRDELDGTVFTNLLEVIKNNNAFTHILRIMPKVNIETEDIKHINYFFNDTFKYNYQKISGVPMHHVVNTYTQIHNIDATFLLVQKESFFERLAFGSPTTKVDKVVKTPLLIYHCD